MFKTSGSGYIIEIIGYNENSKPIASIRSSIVTVHVGDVYKLNFFVSIGTAKGGVPFSPNPSIEVVDRGGNRVESVRGSIRAYASLHSIDILMSKKSFTAPLSLGLAEFDGLYFNTVGFPHMVCFQYKSNTQVGPMFVLRVPVKPFRFDP